MNFLPTVFQKLSFLPVFMLQGHSEWKVKPHMEWVKIDQIDFAVKSDWGNRSLINVVIVKDLQPSQWLS